MYAIFYLFCNIYSHLVNNRSFVLFQYYQRNRNKVTVEVKDVAGDLMQVKNHLDVMLQKKIDAVEVRNNCLLLNNACV